MNKFIGRALVYLAHGPWFKHPGEKKKNEENSGKNLHYLYKSISIFVYSYNYIFNC